MPLTDEQIADIADKVVQSFGDEGTVDVGEASILLLDEAEERVARIASRITAIVFDTRKELKRYIKEHPDADPSNHSVKPKTRKKPSVEPKEPKEKPEEKPTEKPPIGKPEEKTEEPAGKPPAGKPEEKPPAGKPEEKPEKKTPQKPDEDGGSDDSISEDELRDRLQKRFGDKAKEWNTHKVDKSQLSPDLLVYFPNGSSKKYGELSDSEKKEVERQIATGQVASKGLNNYADSSLKTVKGNMRNNLDLYANKKVAEKKNTDKSAVSKKNVDRFVSSAIDNAHSVLDRHASAMSKVSRPMMEKYVEDTVGAVYEAVNDGSLGDVSQADLDEFIREDVKRMIHQEIETRRRSLGDHGIRHIAGNASSAMTMLDEVKRSGIKVTGRDKLMALSIIANHDMGYTAGGVATDVKKSGEHKAKSEALMREDSERYKRMFGKDGVDRMAKITGTHDENIFDWENDPLASAVRLSDATSLFGREKVQDLFIRSPEAMAAACKLKLAAEADPGNKELHGKIKKQLHSIVDKGDFDDNDKEMLHSQVDEMTEEGFSTTTDILSRFSGRLKGFKFDKKSGVMNVEMAYTPEGQVVDSLFGDKVAAKQFNKFVKDMGGSPVEGDKGAVRFDSGGKPAFVLKVENFDKEPIDEATTDAMRKFAEKTVRPSLTAVRRRILPPPAAIEKDVSEAFGYLKKSKSKFTEEEWGEVSKLFDENRGDPGAIVSALAKWPLLESEKAYLSGKTASRRSAMSAMRLILAHVAVKSVFKRFAQLSEKDKEEVLKRVKDKLKDKSGDGEETPESGDEAPEETVETPEDKAEEAPEETTVEEAPEETTVEEAPEGEEEAPEEEVEGEVEEAPEEEAPDIKSVVDGLVDEVEAIKEDGKISPSEVFGLLGNMVQMVQVLLQAKPGRARKSSLRERIIADRVMRRCARFSRKDA